MNTSEVRNAFAEEPEDTLEDYRPINSVALVAFVISLASFLAVTDRFFLFIPIVAIILALIGFAVFAASSRPLVGRRLCTLALCIGTFVITWVVGYESMRRWIISHRAVPIAYEWFDHIQRGELYQAHQLTLDYLDRESPATDLQQHYTKRGVKPGMTEQQIDEFKDSTPKAKLKEFIEREPLNAIVAEAPQAQFEFVRTEAYRRMKESDYVVQIFRMNYQSEGQPKSLEFRVILVRQDLGSYFQAHWRLDRVVGISEPLKF